MAHSNSSSSKDGVVAEVQTENGANSQSLPLLQQQAQAHKSNRDPQAAEAGNLDYNTNAQDSKSYRGMNSFRARLRQARRDPVTPVTLGEWETRGHFWSALDKAAGPKDPSQSEAGALRRWRQRTKVRLKNTAMVIRLRPSVLLWPLLLCALCLTGGLIGVELGARHDQGIKEDEAITAARQAASSLGMAVEESLQPLRTLEMQVQLQPAMSQLGPQFNGIAGQLVLEAPPVVTSLLLAPFGVVRAVYSPAGGSGSSSSAMGVQVLPGAQLQSSQLQTILLQSPAAMSGGSGSGTLVAAHKPVVISDAAANETWGNDPGSGSTAVEGGQLWGFASAVVDVGSTAGGQEAGLQSLTIMGYLYRAQLIANDTGAVLVELQSSPPPAAGSNPVIITEPVTGAAATWQLSVVPEEGWTPQWKAPMTAVVVVVSVVLSVMLLAALVLQYRHVMFLEALLPKKVISVLGTGRNFYEYYDNVTVLYADIVRYSNAPTGSHSWEIVKLLNEVNNIFDGLLDKHGLIKIRRSGEAFMAVGGCPTPGDPVATAVRVALCAREMVLAIASFRSSTGQRVQIRLGLHSGPAVAAVLGTELPRFSLLGDTVDIAYFMESTSNIMRVHVSDTTAELLTIADDPLIMLKPRGVIDIKGRGPITTFWLQLDLFGPMNTFNDQGTMASTHLLPAGGDAGGAGGGNTGGRQRDGAADGDGKGSGGGAAGATPAVRPADIACTADLAVAAQLGVRGAPLVRKLSQTGLTQTRRALPDRRTRAALPYENSIWGSFSMRMEQDTIQLFTSLMKRPSGEYEKILDVPGRPRVSSNGSEAAAATTTTAKAGQGKAQLADASANAADGEKEEDMQPELVGTAAAAAAAPAALERSAESGGPRLAEGGPRSGSAVDTGSNGSGTPVGGGGTGTGSVDAVIELGHHQVLHKAESGHGSNGTAVQPPPVAAAAAAAVEPAVAGPVPGAEPATQQGVAPAASVGAAAAAALLEIEEAE